MNIAYEKFLSIFLSLYNKTCPVVHYSRKIKFAECPWISRGLQNACKKKNALYKVYIKEKTKEARYKKYKNKLTIIIRACKKDHYKTTTSY